MEYECFPMNLKHFTDHQPRSLVCVRTTHLYYSVKHFMNSRVNSMVTTFHLGEKDSTLRILFCFVLKKAIFKRNKTKQPSETLP